jgi:phosphonate transport system ATP-binding protein
MEALSWVNLSEMAAERADALSGGQQQRVAIARALVRRPTLLIADEPAASLDPVSGQDVMALFARLCADHGITLLFTSHDMAHARSFSDRIIALRAGRVVFDKPSATTTDTDLDEVFRVEPR